MFHFHPGYLFPRAHFERLLTFELIIVEQKMLQLPQLRQFMGDIAYVTTVEHCPRETRTIQLPDVEEGKFNVQTRMVLRGEKCVPVSPQTMRSIRFPLSGHILLRL